MKIIIRFWAPVYLWMVVIALLSSIPGEELPELGVPNLDKLLHFLEFFILGILLIRAFLNSRLSMSLVRIVVLSVVIASLYAAFDEWHQYFVSNRMPEVLDFMADLVGSSMGILIYNTRRGESCRR